MVAVDFSNPFLREYFPRWLEAHGRALAEIRGCLPAWAAEGRAAEGRAAAPRPLAAVLDIDEVLLCNVHLNGFRGVQGGAPVDFHAADFFADPATGRPWGREDPGDPPLPGAAALLAALAAEGVRPFFVTGRLESIRAVTVEDFRRAGFLGAAGAPLAAEDLGAAAGRLVMCPDAERPPPGASIRPFKEKARARIAASHRIVLNLGDQLSDLGFHGDHQRLLPHPFYTTF